MKQLLTQKPSSKAHVCWLMQLTLVTFGTVSPQAYAAGVARKNDGPAETANSETRSRKTALAIAAGYIHTCAILDDGSVKCWGDGGNGALGYGDYLSRLVPAAASVDLGPGRTALAIGAGRHYTCVIRDDHALSCWGSGGEGQLGYGEQKPGEIQLSPGGPVNVGSGVTVRTISVGDNHMCAILSDGTVKCWGDGGVGELGTGSTGRLFAPPAAPINLGEGRTALSISAGVSHTCAILDDRSVKCWGAPAGLGYGGEHHMTPPPKPVDLGEGMTALSIASGYGHTCATLNDHSVKCWGGGDRGQLGYGPLPDEDPALRVPPSAKVNLGPGKTALAISAGSRFTCAILNDHSVKCWGAANYGQVGNGRSETIWAPEANPVDLGAGNTAVAISTSWLHTCVILQDGAIKCWGFNGCGEHGDGTYEEAVLAPPSHTVNLDGPQG